MDADMRSGIKEAISNHGRRQATHTHTEREKNNGRPQTKQIKLLQEKKKKCRRWVNEGTRNNDYIRFSKEQKWWKHFKQLNLSWREKSRAKIKDASLFPSHPLPASSLLLDCSLRSVAGGSAADSCAGVCTKWQFGPEDFGWLRLTSWIRALSPHHSAPARRWTVCTAIWKLGGLEK